MNKKSKNNDSLKSANDELNNKLTEKSKEIEQLKKDLQDKLQKLTQNNLSVDTNEVISSQPASSLNTLTAEQSSLSQLISPMTLARNTNTPVSLSVLLSSKDSNSTAITNNNDDNINNNINNNNNNNNKAYESTGTVEDSSSNREIELKKQVQNLMDLLNESERNVRELTKKESNLKEELDKMNRDEKRTTVNMEYLKNVVLRFLESNEKEKLVPVITNLLQLDSKEIERLQAISENKRKFW